MAAITTTPDLFRSVSPRKPLRSETKRVIMNVYSKLRELNPRSSIQSLSKLCAVLCGVSVTTVHRIKSETKTDGKPRSPRRSLFSLARSRPTRKEKYDSFTLAAIKRIVHQVFFSQNHYVTAARLCKVVNDDPDLPNFSNRSMRRVLIDLGFVYSRRKRNSMLIDRQDITEWRSRYLHAIREHRAKGKKIFYLDETWVNAGHHCEYIWQDTTVETSRQAFSEGLTTGLKAPSGAGTRLILTHAGNEDGFVEGALDLFVGNKSKHADYHEEMDGVHFENWFTKNLLPNIPADSVIVMDNASYHSVRLDSIPNTKSRKLDIQNWLSSKGISFTSKMTVKDLLKIVSEEKHKFTGYRIDKLAKDAGHTVLRLPPYHCELNPIELIWSQVKGRVGKDNSTYKIAEVKTLTAESLLKVTPANWKACVDHVIKVEEDMWIKDGLSESTIESFVIIVDEDSSDEDDSGSEGDIEFQELE